MSRKIHYAWIVLAVVFIGVLAAQGIRYSFGAFMNPWEQDFEVSRGTISAISLVSFIVFAISQPAVGKLVDRFGLKKVFVLSIITLAVSIILSFFATKVWHLFILYGVISSIGFGGASGVTASVAVSKWFRKRQGLALGIVEAGFGAGQMIIVPGSLVLIEKYSWETTVLITGAFLLVVVLPIVLLFLKSNPSDVGLKPLEDEKDQDAETNNIEEVITKNQKSFLLHRGFWCLAIPYFVCGFTTTGLMDTHLIPFAQYCGFSVAVTGAAVSLLAIFNTSGTVISGVLADRLNNKGMLVFIYFVRSLTIVFLFLVSNHPDLMLLFLQNPWLLYAFSISFGLVDFAVVPPTVKLLSHFFKNYSLGLITGLLFMSHQLGSALGSYVPGVMFDLTNSYRFSFGLAFVLLLLATILSLMLPKTGEIRLKDLRVSKSANLDL